VPYLAQVRYVFPFRLSLPETLFRVKTEDSMASVRVWSDVADGCLVLRDTQARNPEQGRKILQSKNSQDAVINRTVLFTVDDDVFLEEVIDKVGFTRMDVAFECPGEVPPSDSTIFVEVRGKAIEIAQKFLRGYRTVSEESGCKDSKRDGLALGRDFGVSKLYIYQKRSGCHIHQSPACFSIAPTSPDRRVEGTSFS
jgi:hypothetical protein